MTGYQNRHKPIIFANCKEVLAIVIMFCFTTNLAFGEDENETEFCRRQWSELVNDKREWNTQCLHKNIAINTPCCVATTVYLEQRYQNYIRWCPIVESRCACNYADRDVNHIVFNFNPKQVFWTKPNFTCPHKILFNRKKVEPKKESPHNFSVGLYYINYIFELYGGMNATCTVNVNVCYCRPGASTSHRGPGKPILYQHSLL